MTIIGSDAFTDADDTQLPSHDSHWVLRTSTGTIVITSNAARANYYTDDVVYRWNDTFSDDQYAKGTFVAVSDYYYMGTAVRCSPSAISVYYFTGGGNADSNAYVLKIVSGSGTLIDTVAGASFGASDVGQLEISGTTLILRKNTVNISENTDSSLSSGQAGISGTAEGTGTRLDDWEGGNLGGGGTAVAVFYHHLQQQGIA